MRGFGKWIALLLVQASAFSHTIPEEVQVRMLASTDHAKLHLLVRIPFDALADTVFPVRERGALDLPKVQPMLTDAATIWLADWIDVYENGRLLAMPRVSAARASIATDEAFGAFETAWAQLNGPPLADQVELFPARAAFDVLLEYPLSSGSSRLAIRPRLARLGGSVVTLLQVRTEHARGEKASVRSFGYRGNPGVFELSPGWFAAVARFLPSGFLAIIQGSDYLLFLVCATMFSFRWRFWWPFGVGFAATVAASALGWVPEDLWFPVLFETAIAACVLYLALEVVLRKNTEMFEASGFGFGLLFGFAFSFNLRPQLQFAGNHRLLALQ